MDLKSILLVLSVMFLSHVVWGGTLHFSVKGDTLPYYYEIPAAPEMYSAANVIARMVDGLGFRYSRFNYKRCLFT